MAQTTAREFALGDDGTTRHIYDTGVREVRRMARAREGCVLFVQCSYHDLLTYKGAAYELLDSFRDGNWWGRFPLVWEDIEPEKFPIPTHQGPFDWP